jgi:hypothetical protein
VQSRHVGLVIDGVPDIVYEAIRVRQPGAAGSGGESVVLQEKVTELLSLRHAIQRIQPDVFAFAAVGAGG